MNGLDAARCRAALAGWVGAAFVGFRGLTGTANVISSLAWLGSTGPQGAAGSMRPEAGERGDARSGFVLILPVLREQRVLAGTVGHLVEMAERQGRTSVVVVTTALEDHEVSSGEDVSTPALAAQLVAKAASAGLPMSHVHYPDPNGVMVHQVNHAAFSELTVLTRQGIDLRDVWLAVYNADSRPDPATLEAVADLRRDLTPRPTIVQQSAIFTTSLAECPSGLRGRLLVGIALLQSRWTLAREVPRLRRQSRQARRDREVRWPRLAHCVGHGLFIRADEFRRRGGLPTSTMNEDLAYGYLACAAGVPIDPLPLLERGDSPMTIRGAVRQSRQWFWSYVDYPRCARIAAAHGLGSWLTRAWLSAQGLGRGFLWLGQSPALAATIVLPLASRRRLAAALVAVFAVGSYCVLPVWLTARAERQAGRELQFGPAEAFGVVGAGLMASAGPWWCVASALRRRFTGAVYVHDKTEH